MKQDIHFMWLAAMNRPDFRTLNNFRSGKAKECVEELFKEMLLFLSEHQYISMENYFCNGSTLNRYKIVWKKNAERYKQSAEDKCKELFGQIDRLNADENKQYGDKDLEENGGADKVINQNSIAAHVNKLNKVIETASDKQQNKKAISLKKQLRENEDKINKYQQQITTAKNRSGYNRTDKEASVMRMKNDETLPAYNILAGSENQFIVSYSVHPKYQ